MSEERDYVVLARRRFDDETGAFPWVGPNATVAIVQATNGDDAVGKVHPTAGWDYWAVPFDTQDAYRVEAGVCVEHVPEFAS